MIRWLVRGAWTVSGLLLGAAAVLAGLHRYESAMRNRAFGVVVELAPVRERAHFSTLTRMRPVVRFSTSAGQEVRFVAHDDYPVGDTLNVLYNPMSPDDAQVRSFRGTWLVTTVLAVLGVLIAGAAMLAP